MAEIGIFWQDYAFPHLLRDRYALWVASMKAHAR